MARAVKAGVGPRRLRRWSATGAAALLLLVSHTPAAHAHYKEPPSDWNAAPAVVQVETALRFNVTLTDPKLGLRPYTVEVPGPRGTGAIFDPSGAVITTRQTVMPSDKQARIEAVNRGFDEARPAGWRTPEDLSERQTVDNRETNRQLQACYSPDSGCVTFLGRPRTVVLNTVPVTRLACSAGFKDLGNGLVILPTNEARSDATPTVGIGNDSAADSPFVALGYDESRKLTRFAGRLVGGKPTDADSARIRSTFASDGAGAILVGPAGKGTVLGVVVPTKDEVQVVPPQAGINGAGYRPIRGPLHQRIDNAIGFYYGEHYTHSIDLLKKVTQTLPDAELLKFLKVTQKKAGTAEDKSYGDPMGPATPTATDQGWLRWAWIGLAALVLIAAAVVAVLVLRRRADRRAHGGDDGDDYLDGYDDDTSWVTPAPSAPDQRAEAAVGGAGGAATLPAGRTDPGVALAEVDRPVEDQSAVRYCTSCGAALAAGDRFCYSCGASAR